MITKQLVRAFSLKQVDDEGRTFEGTLAAYSLDQGGDIIVPGAFKQTLADWKARDGKVIPLVDSHNTSSVNNALGHLVDAKEVPKEGLWTKHQFLAAGDPTADAAYARVKAGIVNGMSIGYKAIEVKAPTEQEQRSGIWRYLKAVKLKHSALVLDPMNEDAVVDPSTVKSFDELLFALGRREPSDEELAYLVSEEARIHDYLAKRKASPKPVKCAKCGATVIPTKEGTCPECDAPMGDEEIASSHGKASGGYVPPNVSKTLAPEDEAWSAPSLGDFTDKKWDELDEAKQREIAGHYAYSANNPPKSFGDLSLPHHDPKDGDVVWKGVAAAMARLNQTDVGDKEDAVRAHLVGHYKQFKKEPPAKAAGLDPDDPDRQRMEAAADELVLRGFGATA